MPLTVSILGPLEIRVDGAPVALGGARLRTLMSRLALDAGRAVTVSALVDALWGDEPPEGAANALQSLISRVRKVLGDPALLASAPGGYRLAIAPESVDAMRFESLSRSGREALRADDPSAARATLREALALWRGPALADVADAAFAVAPAARLDELRLAALTDRLDAELRLGHAAEALAELEALGAEHPLRENIAALHVRALYAVGRQADALAVYEQVRRALADQLGIDPSKDLAEVHLAVLRSDPALAPPALEHAPRTNLKSRLTSFVGRDEEVTRIGKMLDASRLVTLVGPGGAGKTRLAGEAAQRVLERFPDGAWLAELAPVTDPGEVPQAVLSALGPRESRMMSSNGSPAAAAALLRSAEGHLIETLAEKRILLILDNCEHLVGAAAGLAETLLGHAPGLRVLATSREPLTIDGESLFPVPPLGLPDAEDFDEAGARARESRRLAAMGRADSRSRTPADGNGSGSGNGNGNGNGLGNGIGGETCDPTTGGGTYSVTDEAVICAPSGGSGSLASAGRNRAPASESADPSTYTVADTVLAYPAVRLFADRAAAVVPDFAVDADTLPDVIRICRSLDGLPLAIELAAARLRTLPLHQIASRLSDRFRLLTGGSRTAMPRHQTLRAVVAWSWELLSDDERDLAERLAVFPGGVTAAAAAAVTPGLDADSAFDLLSALVDKSLLQSVPTEPGQDPRFRMLETLREYGADRLSETGRLAVTRRAHAAFFLELAETAEPQLRRSQQMAWLKRLNAERDNILAALRFAAADEDADTAIRLAAAMSWYWTLGDQNQEGRSWTRLALQVPGPSPKEARAIVSVMARITSVMEDYLWEEVPRMTREIAAEIAALGEIEHPLLALAAVIAPMLSDDREQLNAAVEKYGVHPDPWVGAMLHLMRGMSAENAGVRAPVRADLEHASAVFEELGDRWGLSAALNGLASLAVTDGDDETALRLQSEALELIQEINAFTSAAQIQIGRAQLLTRLGQTDAARALLEEVLESARRSGSQMSCFVAMLGLSEHHRQSGETDRAWHYLNMASVEFIDSWNGPPQLLAFREASVANLYLDSGQTDAARAALGRAFCFGLIARDMPIQARMAGGAARYAHAVGQTELAMRLLGASESMLGAADHSDTERVALVKKLAGQPDYESCYTAGKSATRDENQALVAHTLGLPEEILTDPKSGIQTLRP
ncbi:transcriptional regulator, winged helix family [Catenulispora acidiphila DSM 44928]|uniref:Transcriptional regulator, winged helix family n=1 Tax=Catenulispora acidiphila (strain DSM 44928 / JCM 14897 / NBRC 102108 / NRRL B-24433 / ID139908) TaxID=479433 RepID=C7Q8P3_CATAD|nr:BTAD domain-containing putative transcriptional regulator [Catenulispora acidiphila]ACU70308.1 transcriptional regulator, winged helix family [Catenulispora acidiphila DSM 44928]